MRRLPFVSRSIDARVLAKRRSLKLNGAEIQRTPLLVPSFSSKGFAEVANIIETTKEVIEGPTLVSAYDLHHGFVTGPFDFASMLFLDSGGYESSKDWELSEISEREYRPRPWSQALHNDVLANWSSTVPTVFISYDHPKERLRTGEQIARARAAISKRSDVMHETLLKPETETARFLDVHAILPHIHDLAPFDAIGVTEKEIGNSILERMEHIARLRNALTAAGMDIPIHVFGSLDTITSPMYFLPGADIFDGLTWLRFAFYKGYDV